MKPGYPNNNSNYFHNNDNNKITFIKIISYIYNHINGLDI